jgi:hypothetical protein
MRESDKSAAARRPQAPAAPITPIHVAFSWLHSSLERDPRAEFVALTLDVCNGVRVCLQVVQQGLIDAQCNHRPLMSPNDQERLVLLATRSAEMLARLAEAEIDHLNDGATKGGAV